MNNSEGTRLIQNLRNGISQKVLCLGTSNYVNDISFSGGTWIPQVEQKLNQIYSGKATFYAEGQGGESSRKGAEIIDDLLKQYKPNVVVLGFAINDGCTGYDESVVRSNIEYMVSTIRNTLQNIEIIFCNIISPEDVPEYDSRSRRKYHQAALKLWNDIAKEQGLLHVNLYYKWDALRINDNKTFLSYTTEGIHMNPDGNLAITTPGFIEAITFCKGYSALIPEKL